MNQKFFLYARKSTDVEDKQVLSIDAQITELREFAKRENLQIAEVFIEKRTAKIPGRPIFNDMITKLEQGEADGILAWHPDRLARNSVDGGKIIYLLDIQKIATLKFPQFWFEPTSQGKFMLNIAFGQSKYYVDSLSENVKRGLRQKVRNGIYPSLAPVGYLNDIRHKVVVIDPQKSGVIKGAFELYGQGQSRLEDIGIFLAQKGIKTKTGKKTHRDSITFILSNPFYYGHFRYGQEIYEGKHVPIITKKLFDTVQEILKQRGRPHKKLKNEPQAFCELLRCGECQMMITAEKKTKPSGRQYVYYRCTKKSKARSCHQPFIREEELDRQLSEMIQKVSLPEHGARQMLSLLEKDKKTSATSCAAFVREANERITTINTRLQILLDGYLDQDIEKEVYRVEKAKYMSTKKTLEEDIIRAEQKQYDRLEPLKEWIVLAESAAKITPGGDLRGKKVLARKIFGSNLTLTTKKAHGLATGAWSILEEAGPCPNFVARTGIAPVFSP